MRAKLDCLTGHGTPAGGGGGGALGEFLEAGNRMKQVLVGLVVATTLLACASSAIAQRSGPVSSSDVGTSGRYVPQAAPQDDRESSSRSTRSERRATRGVAKLVLGGIAGIGALGGAAAAKGNRSPKHKDGRAGGRAGSRAKGRGVMESSNVPPGSTRFR